MGQSLWQQLGVGLGSGGPRCLLEDTNDDVLYVSGAMTVAGDGTIIPGIGRWDGQSFQPMDCGFNWDCTPPINTSGMANGGILTMAFWNGELYAGGDIYLINGEPAYNIARWDGSAWQHLGTGLDGIVTRLHGYDDGLYATGYFNTAGGQPAHGLARWDGTTWHNVFDFPLFGPTEVNLIHDMAWYNDELYVGGNFGGDAASRDLVRFDGVQWSAVDNGIRGSFSLVNLLEVHDGLLYVAGAFAQSGAYGPPDNPGCGIVTWDGEQWGTLGEGTCGSSNPTIYRMSWIQDTLYVTGRFNTIGGVPTGRVAKWDGSRWCSLVPPGYFYPDIVALGSFRDTLIVGGSFTVAGPDSILRIAQWVGGAYTSACGTAVGFEEMERSEERLRLYPNPAHDRIGLILNGAVIASAQFSVANALGQVVLVGRTGQNGTVDVGGLASGCYALSVVDDTGGLAHTAQFIRQ